ncbi:hypothetical protein GCM10009596_23080 [Arthrobacter rhombi]
MEYRHDALGIPSVGTHARFDDGGQWRKPYRGAHRHGGSDAETTAIVGGGEHHGTGPRVADNDLTTNELGPFQQLDRNVKGIHVHMKDGTVLLNNGHGPILEMFADR